MSEILPIFLISICLAYCSQKGFFVTQITENKKFDIPLTALIIMLSFFCGLRTDFNDTYLYVKLFKTAVPLSEYLETLPEWSDNPLFYGFQSYFRNDISENYHLYLLVISFFTVTSFVLFIKRHSTNFTLSIVIFFSIELFTDTMGMMKQCIAMAILTYALEALFKKKYLLYFIIVLFAILWHTYAIFFIILPFFQRKPWTLFTYVAIIVVIISLLSFESTLTMLQNAAEETGKNLAEEELLDNNGVNIFRLAVFAIPPLLSFIFQNQTSNNYNVEKSVLMNMSILSFLIMSMGIFTAANLFSRCATYFEIGSIVILPWLLENIFDKKSLKSVLLFVGICYMALFAFMTTGFDNSYASIGIGQFFIGLTN